MASENNATRISTAYSSTSVNRALNFNRDYFRLRDYYETWSTDYDNDVSEENYCGPLVISDLLTSLLGNADTNNRKPRSALRIMDACCGTGLVGKQLTQRGFSTIDGCDLSPAMTQLARQTQAYGALYGGVDLTEHNTLIADSGYDATLCCGAFIEGHLPIEAIHELIRMTAPGGLLLFSTRCTFYEAENFADLLGSLVATKKLSPLPSLMNAPYLDEVHAHYLAFRITR
ncbi:MULTISPECIES: class I SAM-dependent methyltransferase [Pseudomonas]|uniref:class I SAM-dependent DNA methyltransferase n=1 Tax=Pseudomonas TaxID=286 RepID=UPI000E6C5155|nr:MULTISPECIES: class I SAM-dependent methyltransferase [Pseudomonas]MBK3509561.1 class I SAM-dependent methyltransferase [Pseudomonas sp. MF6747]MBT0623463.1 class I SAM-dependent methyltransferase [Pseudomonas fluorescens]